MQASQTLICTEMFSFNDQKLAENMDDARSIKSPKTSSLNELMENQKWNWLETGKI